MKDEKRLLQCEYCGLKFPDDEFVSYKLDTNIGRCRKCDATYPPIELHSSNKLNTIMKLKMSTCPECEGKLIKRIGSNGPFLGCENYPNCTYTRSISKRNRA